MSISSSELSRDDLVAKLKEIAQKHRNPDAFKKAVKEEIPDICVDIIYSGPMYMGHAMSHHHPGSISF